MYGSEGILTARGGMTSHAAVVARGWGRPCICGCISLNIDEENGSMTVKLDDGSQKKRQRPAKPDISDLLRVARPIWGRKDGLDELSTQTEDRKFREFFGCPALVALTLWNLFLGIHNRPDKSVNPTTVPSLRHPARIVWRKAAPGWKVDLAWLCPATMEMPVMVHHLPMDRIGQ